MTISVSLWYSRAGKPICIGGTGNVVDKPFILTELSDGIIQYRVTHHVCPAGHAEMTAILRRPGDAASPASRHTPQNAVGEHRRPGRGMWSHPRIPGRTRVGHWPNRPTWRRFIHSEKNSSEGRQGKDGTLSGHQSTLLQHHSHDKAEEEMKDRS
jgi:hypothetical protein